MQDTLSNYMIWTINTHILASTIIFLILGIRVMKNYAEGLTESICYLYETLNQVANKIQDEEADVTPNVLTFNYQNHEINELQRTFNSIVKTMIIVRQ